jgi:predicted O-methyltransferase YrrM
MLWPSRKNRSRDELLASLRQLPERERAELLAETMSPLAGDPTLFDLWQEHGFHVTPVHFYQPIPDTRELVPELWDRESPLAGVDWRVDAQLALLDELGRYAAELDDVPFEKTQREADFYLKNPLFGGTDALVLYALLRHAKPRRVVEVGSGFSTLLAVRALAANQGGTVTCIEPYPSGFLRQLDVELISEKVQTVGYSVFESLTENDVLFIDSSHVVKCGGDVNLLFLEILPRLRPGVIVHVHDVFLPREVPRDWLVTLHYFWTEQYLLHAFLIFNSGYRVLLANAYLGAHHAEAFKRAFPRSTWWGGASFWMQRRSEIPTASAPPTSPEPPA